MRLLGDALHSGAPSSLTKRPFHAMRSLYGCDLTMSCGDGLEVLTLGRVQLIGAG